MRPTHQLAFKIRGMDCAEEIAVLKREVGPLVGGEARLAFDLLKGKMTVEDGHHGAAEAAILRAVERTGMHAQPWEERPGRSEKLGFWQEHGRTVLAAVSGSMVLAGFAMQADSWIGRALYLVAILTGSRYVLPKAWLALRRLRPDMNLVMTIAVVGAVGLGEWLEAATVSFLFALSLTLESWSVARARRAVAALLDLTPQTARVLRADGREEEIPAEQVEVGSSFVLRPGERIPLDGLVLDGASAVDQSTITGESLPVPKTRGEPVFAGTINGNGALVCESTKRQEETTLAHIIRMVEEAQSRRAPSEQWVERFARVYTPAVMAGALLVLLVPPLAFGASWEEWIYRALALLVIACPCALVISTPVSIVAALASAARHGVLIKGGLYVEIPARLRAVALDKTGTLTRGRPEVVEVIALSGHDERELLERVGALEARSEHPLARAILAHAKERGVAVRPAEDFRILQGEGAAGRFDGREYWLGSHRYLEDRGQETPEIHARLEAMSSAGQTAVVAGTDEHVCGLIAVADAVRPEAKACVQALRDAGVEAVVMLTGDNRGTAESIGRETGLDEVRAELLPAEKVSAIDQLTARYGQVAMIGDGVNDAPAMARATLSVAMGAAGSDAAIEAADVALMTDDLSKLPWLIRHSRRTLAVIRQNIAFSLLIKAAFVGLTFAGFATLWGAIAADMGASLLVIANGLRLLRTASSSGTPSDGRIR